MNKTNFLIFLLLLFACISCKEREKILIDGSSTVYPITEAVAEEYKKHDPSVHVIVGISGTGGGFKKFCAGEINITNASREIKKKEIEKCSSNKIEYFSIPVAYDGLAVVVNKKNENVNSLSIEQLNKIFKSKNKAVSWNEIDKTFPSKKIKIFSPGQDSGTYEYFSKVVLGKKEEIRPDATFSEDDNVLVTGVHGEEGGIAFFGIAYYEQNKDKLRIVSIVNPKSKKVVLPTQETVRSGEYYPLSRPIFIYVNKKIQEKEKIAKFVKFYLDNAKELSKEVGYVPLPDRMYSEIKAKFF